MSFIKKNKRTVTVTREAYDTVQVCDSCGLKIGRDLRSSYGVDEVEIEVKKGTCYPGDGYDNEFYGPRAESEYFVEGNFDVCGPCWREKFIPLLTKPEGAEH